MKSNYIAAAIAFSLIVIIASLFIGPSEFLFKNIVHNFLNNKPLFESDSQKELFISIIFDIRASRVLLSFMVGASLSVSGAALQAMLRNPLVSPYVLGLSSGAAFGAALALAFGFFSTQVSAFVFGASAVLLSYYIAKSGNQVSVLPLILSGVIVSGIFSALLTIIQFISDPFKLQSIVHWTMGNLHNATWEKAASIIIPFILGSAILVFFSFKINVLSLGDDEALSVGVNPAVLRMLILIPATLLASSSVAVAGVIGMVGLIIPHVVRIIAGADNRNVIPLSFFLGGSFLVIVDTISRTLFTFEMPIGVFTMLIGGPFFIYLIKKSHLGMQ